MNNFSVFYTPAATDRRLSDLSVRLYALLLARGIWRGDPIAVSTSELAAALWCNVATVRVSLRQLDHAGYIDRRVRGRVQHVRALHWLAAS